MMYAQILKCMLPYLIGAMIAGGVVWKVQGVRLDSAKASLKQAVTDLTACQEANATSQATIGRLKDDISHAQATCGKRISIKEALIDKVRQIDSLKPIPTKEVNHESTPAPVSSVLDPGPDPLLGMLNGMFGDPGPGGKN